MTEKTTKAKSRKRPDTKDVRALLKMEDLKSNMCRWPYGDPRNREKFHFCGERCDSDSSYCTKHSEAAKRSGGAPAGKQQAA